MFNHCLHNDFSKICIAGNNYNKYLGAPVHSLAFSFPSAVPIVIGVLVALFSVIVIGLVAAFLIILSYYKKRKVQSYNVTQSFSDVNEERASADSENLGMTIKESSHHRQAAQVHVL